MTERLIGRFRVQDHCGLKIADGENEEQPKKGCGPVLDTVDWQHGDPYPGSSEPVLDEAEMSAEEHRAHIESGRSADKASRDMATFVANSNKRHGIGDRKDSTGGRPTKDELGSMSPIERFVAASQARHAPNPAADAEAARRKETQ